MTASLILFKMYYFERASSDELKASGGTSGKRWTEELYTSAWEKLGKLQFLPVTPPRPRSNLYPEKSREDALFENKITKS